MKVFVVLAVIVACASAAPSYGVAPAMPVHASYEAAPVKALEEKMELHMPTKAPVAILKLDIDNDNKGQYSLHSETADGSKISESATLKDLGDKHGPVSVSKGSYSFVGDDGKTYTVNWTADERGFRAEGEHLPTPPPIPEELRKAIEENMRNCEQAMAMGNQDENSYVKPEASAPLPAKPAYSSYSAPAPMPAIKIESQYPAPTPVKPAYSSYSAPAPMPAIKIESHFPSPAPLPVKPAYSAPAPVKPDYSAPAPAPLIKFTSIAAPAPAPVKPAYSAPAPVKPDYSAPAPAPVIKISSYAAPAPAAPAPAVKSTYYAPAPAVVPAPVPAPTSTSIRISSY